MTGAAAGLAAGAGVAAGAGAGVADTAGGGVAGVVAAGGAAGGAPAGGIFDVQVGAGIVADSVPTTEYEETLSKAKAMLKAVEIAEKGF